MKCPCDNLKTQSRVADLDYVFDWAPETNGRECADGDYLELGETITAITITTPAGLTEHDIQLIDSGTAVEVWFTGGTPGDTYKITCEISTNLGRTDSKDLYLTIT